MKRIVLILLAFSILSPDIPVFSQYSTRDGEIIIPATEIETPESAKRDKITIYGIPLDMVGVGVVMAGGYLLMPMGWVVLGRDIMVGTPILYYSGKAIVKRIKSWGSFEQLEVRAKYFNEAGKVTNKLSAGETGRIELKIINRGVKPVKDIDPSLRLLSITSQYSSLQFENLRIKGPKTLLGGYRLSQDESMTVEANLTLPHNMPETSLKYQASLSGTRKGTSALYVQNYNPPDLLFTELQFVDEDGNEILDGLETGQLRVDIVNGGKGPARNVEIVPDVKHPHVTITPSKKDIQQLNPSEKQALKFQIEAGRGIEDGIASITLEAQEKNGYDARPVAVQIQTHRFVPPEIAISDWSINDGNTGLAKGNGNFLAENGETIELNLSIQNLGQGPAYGCVLLPESSSGVHLLTKRIPIGLIAPQSSVSTSFGIDIPISYRDDVIDIQLFLKDSRGVVTIQDTVSLENYVRKPVLEYDYVVYDGNSPGSKGNQNGIIEQGETIELEILPQNMGNYQAEDVEFRVNIDYPGIVSQESFTDNYLQVGAIEPKSTGNAVKFQFTVQRSAAPGTFNVNIDMQQANFAGLSESIPMQLKEETIETVSFGNQNSSEFGRFNTNQSNNVVNVDVAPHLNNQIGDAIAVVIGNKNYRVQGVPSVDYAERDARIFKSYLTRTLGFRESDILYYTDASFTDFNEIFGTKEEFKGKLYSRVKENTKVFVYYSGHGAPDVKNGSGYFVPSDSDPSKITLTGYPVDLLLSNLTKLRSDDISVVIDACFSGKSNEGDFLIKGISPAMLKLKNPEVVKGVSVFSASEIDQVSSWYPEVRHGVFTYYFLAGMKGFADNNEDDKITYGEMAAYLENEIPEKVLEISGGQREQNPTFRGNSNKILLSY